MGTLQIDLQGLSLQPAIVRTLALARLWSTSIKYENNNAFRGRHIDWPLRRSL